MSELYRAFIGWDYDEPDEAWLDVRNLPWEEARRILLDKVRLFLDDDCPVCKADGEDIARRMEAAEPGTEFEENIDGDDVLLYSEDRPASEPTPKGPGRWVEVGYTTDGP